MWFSNIYIYTLYIYIYDIGIVSKNSLKRNLVFLNHLTIIYHAQLLRFWSFFVVFSFRKDPLGYVLLNTGWLISRDPYYGLLQSPNSWVVYIVPLYTLNNQGLFFHWSIGSFEYVTITVIIRNRNPKFMSESISMRQKKDDKPTCLKPPMVNFGHFGGELPNIESIQSVVTVVLSSSLRRKKLVDCCAGSFDTFTLTFMTTHENAAATSLKWFISSFKMRKNK